MCPWARDSGFRQLVIGSPQQKMKWLCGRSSGAPTYLVKLNCRNRNLHCPRWCSQENLGDATCIRKYKDLICLLKRTLQILEEW
jgi:hypothetical protein